MVLLADPGAPGHDVHDLVGDNPVHVYVGADDHDPVSLLGRGPLGGPGLLGADPAAASYGAVRFGVPQGGDDITGVLGLHNHAAGHYLHPGGAGIHNVSTISAGGAPLTVDGRDDHKYQPLSHVLLDAAESGLPGPLRGLLHLL